MTTHTILTGDVLDGLRTLPDNSIPLTITSPPYGDIRTYGGKDTPEWDFGGARYLPLINALMLLILVFITVMREVCK